MTDEVPKAPIKLNVPEGTPHKVEKMGDGRFMDGVDASYTKMVESNGLKPLMRR